MLTWLAAQEKREQKANVLIFSDNFSRRYWNIWEAEMIEIHEEMHCDSEGCGAVKRTKTYYTPPANPMKLPTLPEGWVAVTKDSWQTKIFCPTCSGPGVLRLEML